MNGLGVFLDKAIHIVRGVISAAQQPELPDHACLQAGSPFTQRSRPPEMKGSEEPTQVTSQKVTTRSG